MRVEMLLAPRDGLAEGGGLAMGPPDELLRGQAGPEAWRNEAKATMRAAQQLRGRCWREAVAQWRPPQPPGQPQETPYERRTRLQGWRFKLDVTAAGETLEKPPEGPGITLWKSKMKPPPWVSQLPLPCFRDHCASQSNGLAAHYASAVRLVVSRLRQALTELNEQAKCLNLSRQHLDAALAKVRTALLTNRQSALVRGHRPPAEQAPDQVDALLRWERKELQRLKVELEGHMDMSEAHLKAPDQVDALLRWERKELQRLKVELEGHMDMSEAHLKERLYMALGGMRSTLNRCQRFHGELGITQGMTMGPESSQYLEAREKLTRPLVRVYQHHVGTQLPEAQILTQGSVLLERSLQKAAANVQQMQATQRHLRASIRDKQTGFHVDASVQPGAAPAAACTPAAAWGRPASCSAPRGPPQPEHENKIRRDF
ncbi:hypothetical protein UY3_09343 [Chelonia mydas]|uniref:Coiled-coil domain-containing protein 105 n=1 Tax=Chelonia mydas TaxID=8469 RepID=M7BNA0_CHEMY|nr:hypothetical protein UY3_09343 [Chelonia mydas]